MPSIVKGGPKLPSFQKLKHKKRAAPESAESLKEAPKAKKNLSNASNAIPSSSQEPSDHPKVAKDTKKRSKSLDWKKKMSAEKEERLKKVAKGPSQNTAVAAPSVPKIEPGQNWKKLQSTMTHVRKTALEKDAKELDAGVEKGESEKASVDAANMKQKKQEPPGWNVSSVEETDVVGIDCEMVGVGLDGKYDSLARVVVVNYYGGVLLDRFVSQLEKVEDFRTHVSGIRPEDLKNGVSLKQVQKEVYRLLKDKIVVGHGLASDFKVLLLDFPQLYIRDTARYRALQKSPGKPHSLRQLAAEVLEMQIQDGEHDPIEDAQIAILLYRFLQKNWEASIKTAVKNPASVNPITKILERANRAAINAPKSTKNEKTQKQAKHTSNRMQEDQTHNDKDSWASDSESESSDSDQDSNSDSSEQTNSDSESNESS